MDCKTKKSRRNKKPKQKEIWKLQPYMLAILLQLAQDQTKIKNGVKTMLLRYMLLHTSKGYTCLASWSPNRGSKFTQDYTVAILQHTTNLRRPRFTFRGSIDIPFPSLIWQWLPLNSITSLFYFPPRTDTLKICDKLIRFIGTII